METTARGVTGCVPSIRLFSRRSALFETRTALLRCACQSVLNILLSLFQLYAVVCLPQISELFQFSVYPLSLDLTLAGQMLDLE